MPRPAREKSPPTASTATVGFEAKLWLTADKLRNNMDAAEPERSGDSQPKAARRASEARQYKHVVLGLTFLKYISDTAGKCRRSNAEIRTRRARTLRHSKFVLRRSPAPTIGKTVDDAMVAIERDNPRLKGVLPKDYARPGLDTTTRDSASPDCDATPRDFYAAKGHQRLGELIGVIAA